MSVLLEAFRLLGGPCDGEVADLPTDGFEQTWRCVHLSADPVLYAEYRRDGAVFRYVGRTLTMQELADLLREEQANVTIGVDSREYER